MEVMSLMRIPGMLLIVLTAAVIIRGFIRWGDQSFSCALGRILGGAILGMFLRWVIFGR